MVAAGSLHIRFIFTQSMGGVAGGGKNDDPYRVILKMKPVTWGVVGKSRDDLR
jgi:hypothetical protein